MGLLIFIGTIATMISLLAFHGVKKYILRVAFVPYVIGVLLAMSLWSAPDIPYFNIVSAILIGAFSFSYADSLRTIGRHDYRIPRRKLVTGVTNMLDVTVCLVKVDAISLTRLDLSDCIDDPTAKNVWILIKVDHAESTDCDLFLTNNLKTIYKVGPCGHYLRYIPTYSEYELRLHHGTFYFPIDTISEIIRRNEFNSLQEMWNR